MVFGRPNRWPARSPLRAWEYPLLALLVACGVALRGWDRSDVPLWSDEAETSLNALTILEGGLPRDEYLGIPIFENTLTKPWPANVEYEFRDTSYSEDGLAIYHGWLPLYAQAASFAVTGIVPDRAPSGTPRYSEAEMRHRTWAARLPALVFSALFLVVVFLSGRELYGTDGAWTAAAAAAVSTSAITFGQQGRYYSSTLAMTTLCCLCVCLVLRRGRWRDYAGAAISLVLLFHTHVLSFIVVCAVAVLVLPSTLSTPSIVRKLVLGAAIVLAGTVPWVLFTGFFEAAADRPPARSLLSAADIVRYPLERWIYVLLALVSMAWLIAAPRLRNRIGGRFVDPFVGYRRPLFLLAAWALIAYAAFIALIPAASFFASRLTLVVFVPSLLFGAMLFAAAGRVIWPRYSPLVGAVAFVGTLSALDRATLLPPPAEPDGPSLFRLIDDLRRIGMAADTRLYATAGENLILRFYTGMPFQNVMPVRKTFLDSYPGEVRVLESPPVALVTAEETQRIARRYGRDVDRRQAAMLARQSTEILLRRRLATRSSRMTDVATDEPVVEAIAAFQQTKTLRDVAAAVEETGNPMFRGYDIQDYEDMWRVFFYRFVDPAARMGVGLNYADRIRDADVEFLHDGWLLFRSRAPTAPPGSLLR